MGVPQSVETAVRVRALQVPHGDNAASCGNNSRIVLLPRFFTS
jgi:hypothetical protein